MSTLSLQKLVTELRSFVNAVDQTSDVRIAEAASDYSQACRAANDRLTRCAALLNDGHRSEAIAIASDDPDLLEAVSALNFPELYEWQELAAQYGWDRPAALKTEVLDAINSAYVM